MCRLKFLLSSSFETPIFEDIQLSRIEKMLPPTSPKDMRKRSVDENLAAETVDLVWVASPFKEECSSIYASPSRKTVLALSVNMIMSIEDKDRAQIVAILSTKFSPIRL